MNQNQLRQVEAFSETIMRTRPDVVGLWFPLAGEFHLWSKLTDEATSREELREIIDQKAAVAKAAGARVLILRFAVSEMERVLGETGWENTPANRARIIAAKTSAAY